MARINSNILQQSQLVNRQEAANEVDTLAISGALVSRYRSSSKSISQQKNHGAVDASPIINATTLLAAKYPSSVAHARDAKSKAETRVVLLVTSVILAIIAYGWTQWANINFERTSEFTYNSGLIGGILMLTILLYAVRKRVGFLKKLGGIESWYYFHLIGGVIGPLLIVFHSSFQLKSINSSVALFSMIAIVVSGLFGRYIYTRIGFSLHRKLLSIKNTENALIESIRKYQSENVLAIEKRLAEFSSNCLAGPKVLITLPLKLLSIQAAGARCYVKSAEDLTVMLQKIAQQNGWAVDVYKKLLAAEKLLLRKHINSVVEIAKIHQYERFLVRWRILHIPLLYILVVTGVAHVFAVHMY